jgi:hypothetical protein
VGNSNFISLPQLITKTIDMKEIKTERKKHYIIERKLEFGNHQFAECSDIKTRMVWVVLNNEEPLLNYSFTK